MSLASPVFLLYIFITAAVHYALPQKFRNAFLLIASLVFYMWAVPEFGAAVVFTVIFSYFAAIGIGKRREKKRKICTAVSICAVLALLFVFKYLDFFTDTVVSLLSLFGLSAEPGRLGLAVPAGISFYTFQTVGYLADVSSGKTEPETNFIDYALFVTFFPAILSGPIGRAGELLPQYKKPREFRYENFRIGCQRILSGAFRKIVLADGIGLLVSRLYTDIPERSGAELIAAFLLYGLQIYCDFAGYTEIAVGTARILGIGLRENFNVPYAGTDLADFWSRWHMSLTSWLRDYIYIPLGGNRRSKGRKLLNILIVFLVSGIWHGAALRYVLWGLIHAVLRITEEILPALKGKPEDKAIVRWLKRIKVYVVASLAFIFFRLDLNEAVTAIRRMFTALKPGGLGRAFLSAASLDIASTSFWYAFYLGTLAASLLLMTVLDNRIVKTGNPNPLETISTVPRWIAIFFMEASVILFYILTSGSGAVNFIYFGY